MRPAQNVLDSGDLFSQYVSDDELAFLGDTLPILNKYGLAIVFWGPNFAETCCIFLVVPFPGFKEAQDVDNLPDSCLIHGVEYTGDLITDVTCLLNSFSEMGRADSDFGHFNTITRWDASEVGLA